MNRTSTSILAVLLVASFTACAQEAPPEADAAPDAPAAAATTTTPAKTATPAPENETEVEDAAAAQESSGDAEPADRSDAGLARLAALPADQQLPNGRWKAGAHYRPLVPAQPTNVDAGEVEVVEVFWYGCPHCYALDPIVDNWDKKNAPYVQVVKMPVMWSDGHKAHARLFFALEALGRQDLHKKVFEAIHEKRAPNMLLGQSTEATRKLHADFARSQGIAEADFLKAYNSFAVNANLQRAERLMESYQVAHVPIMVVNGKYVTDASMAGGEEQLFALIDDLAASEKR